MRQQKEPDDFHQRFSTDLYCELIGPVRRGTVEVADSDWPTRLNALRSGEVAAVFDKYVRPHVAALPAARQVEMRASLLLLINEASEETLSWAAQQMALYTPTGCELVLLTTLLAVVFPGEAGRPIAECRPTDFTPEEDEYFGRYPTALRIRSRLFPQELAAAISAAAFGGAPFRPVAEVVGLAPATPPEELHVLCLLGLVFVLHGGGPGGYGLSILSTDGGHLPWLFGEEPGLFREYVGSLLIVGERAGHFEQW